MRASVMKGKQRASTALGWCSSNWPIDGIKNLSLWATALTIHWVHGSNTLPARHRFRQIVYIDARSHRLSFVHPKHSNSNCEQLVLNNR